jgi:hypothetical protein
MSGSWVVVRRAGALWGLRASSVAGVEGGGGRLRIRLAAGGELEAEAVVGLADRLEVRRTPSAARRLLPDGVGGLALHRGQPLLILDERAERNKGPVRV